MLGSVHLWGNGEVVQTPKSVYNGTGTNQYSTITEPGTFSKVRARGIFVVLMNLNHAMDWFYLHSE